MFNLTNILELHIVIHSIIAILLKSEYKFMSLQN